jgi:hypothetical protein
MLFRPSPSTERVKFVSCRASLRPKWLPHRSVVSRRCRCGALVSPQLPMSWHKTLGLLLHGEVEEASNFLVGPSFAWGFYLGEFV